MKKLCKLALILFFGATAGAQRIELPEAYQLCVSRNIFDANRQPPRKESSKPPPPLPKADPVHTLTLTGVVIHNGMPHALFSGTSSDLSGLKSLNETIGPFSLEAVTSEKVSLKAADMETMDLRVGYSLSQQGESPWKASEQRISSSSSRSSDGATSSTTKLPAEAEAIKEASDDTSTSGSSPADILKRLRERRQKELN